MHEPGPTAPTQYNGRIPGTISRPPSVGHAPLIGRAPALEVLRGRLDAVGQHGSSLVIVGEPGIGKSALMSASAADAAARGFSVLRTLGVPSEAKLPFAALFSLLDPIAHLAEELPCPQREAIYGALGRTETTGVDPAFLALASLNLIRESAIDAPVLIVVEDLHWLDEQSVEVLGFIARRIEHDPVVLLASSRISYAGRLDDPRIEEITVEGLDDEASRALVEIHAPDLAAPLRDQLLDVANGNPLALIELSLAWSRLPPGTLIPELVPLTDRLMSVFTERYEELPPPLRVLLLVAALAGGDFGPPTMDAASAIASEAVDPSMLATAVDARLLRIEGTKVRCRHPLVPAAIAQVATVDQRRAAHLALADALPDVDLATWHRAAAVIGANEGIAVALDAAAARAKQRGAMLVAVTALERAAELSPDPTARGRRLVRAAELAAELGRPDAVDRLLDEAEHLALDPVDRARAMWRRQTLGDGSCRSVEQVQALVATIDQMIAAGDAELALDSLVSVADTAWLTNFDAGRRAAIAAAADRLTMAPDDARLLSVIGLAQPVERGAAVLDRIRVLTPSRVADPGDLRLLGTTAGFLGDQEVSAFFLDHAVRGLRAQGRLGPLANGLVSQSWTAWHLGRWDLASSAAAEAVTLGHQAERPATAMGARLVLGALAGARGDAATAEAIAAEVDAAFRPLGATTMLALSALVRGFALLSDGRVHDAFFHLQPYFEDDDLGAVAVVSQGSLGTFVEAALQCGRVDEARRAVERTARIAASGSSPTNEVVLGLAGALLADDDHAESAFRSTLRSSAASWPLPRARVLLAQGTWLRRQQRVIESRTPLRESRDLFDALGALSWSERARNELRAAGETSDSRRPLPFEQLTAQEVEIVRLAAAGMTNREIGQRLYLSHRTVGSHLYRAFPKLGVTSRRELPDLLAAHEDRLEPAQ